MAYHALLSIYVVSHNELAVDAITAIYMITAYFGIMYDAHSASGSILPERRFKGVSASISVMVIMYIEKTIKNPIIPVVPGHFSLLKDSSEAYESISQPSIMVAITGNASTNAYGFLLFH